MTKIMAGNCVHYSGRHPFPESRPAVSFLARKDEIPVFLPVFLYKKDQFIKAPVKCRPLHRGHVAHVGRPAVADCKYLIFDFLCQHHFPSRKFMADYENSTICKVLHTRLYSPCLNACLLLCRTFLFRYFLFREMPRRSSAPHAVGAIAPLPAVALLVCISR